MGRLLRVEAAAEKFFWCHKTANKADNSPVSSGIGSTSMP
jgi:hypothetical protein